MRQIKIGEVDETNGFTIYYKDTHIEIVERPENITVRQLFNYLEAIDKNE